MRRLVLRGALVAGVAILAVAASAHATFPGVNGNIAYSYCEDGPDCQVWHVWITPRHGAAFPYVPPQRLFADPAGVFEDDPAFSADGRQVAASRCTAAGSSLHCGIAVVDALGRNLRQLTPMDGSVEDDFPAFSPDGNTIAFTRGDASTSIWLMAADGTNSRPITAGPADSYPDFSPDGGTIAFARSGQIWLMNADGTNQRLLSSSSTATFDAPSLSPDGKQVAFDSCPASTSDPCQLEVVNVDGSGGHPLFGGASLGDVEPAFSPAGDLIAYTHSDDGSRGGAYVVAPLTAASDSGLGAGDDYKVSWGRMPNPSIDSSPQVFGNPLPGQALFAGPGATPWGGVSKYQWMRCNSAGQHCVFVQPQNTSTLYVPSNADVGHRIRVLQEVSDAAGTANALSATAPLVPHLPQVRLPGAVRVSHGNAFVAVSIPARLNCGNAGNGALSFSRCSLQVTFWSRLSAKVSRKRARFHYIGSKAVKVLAGQRRVLRIRLNAVARQRFAHARRVKVRVVAVVKDWQADTRKTTRSVTLRFAGHG